VLCGLPCTRDVTVAAVRAATGGEAAGLKRLAAIVTHGSTELAAHAKIANPRLSSFFACSAASRVPVT